MRERPLLSLFIMEESRITSMNASLLEDVGRFPELHLDKSQDLETNGDDGITGEEAEHLIIDDDTSIHRNSLRSSSDVTSTAFPPFMDQLKERAGWLIGLLILQSCSSFIIQCNKSFFEKH